MACGSCGGPQQPSDKWELTTEDGTSRVYLTQVEARVAAAAFGGGTIRKIT